MDSYKFTFSETISRIVVTIFFKCCGCKGERRENIYHYNPRNYFTLLITKYGFEENNNEILYKNTDKLFDLLGIMVDYVFHSGNNISFAELLPIIKNNNNTSNIDDFYEESYQQLYDEILKVYKISSNYQECSNEHFKTNSNQLTKINELLIELMPMLRMPSKRQIIVIWNSFKQEFISNNNKWGYSSDEHLEWIKINTGYIKLDILRSTYNSIYPSFIEQLWNDFILYNMFNLYDIYYDEMLNSFSSLKLKVFLEENLINYN